MSTQLSNSFEQTQQKNSDSITKEPTLEELVAAIRSQIQPVPTTNRYRATLLLAAGLMVLLPLVYVSIVILVAWGVCTYAYYGTALLQTKGNKTAVAIAYFGPLIMGTIAVLFMIKPLFARPPKSAKPYSLDRADQPKLFAFVERLCDAVHAPVPKRIDVDCEVNASASYRRGLASVFLSNDLVLTIGLPLVSGMTLQQFAGVLAHEFGHFSQGFGMRLSYLIRSINHWFARVVYQRDRLDFLLDRTASAIDFRIGIMLHGARMMVWLTRKILWALMMVGNAACSYLLRQMEYDADLHEIRFSGSSSFSETAFQLRRLSIAQQQALIEQRNFANDGKLANNMPRLTKVNSDSQDETLIGKLRDSLKDDEGHWYDTHPLDRDRVARATLENAAGVFECKDSAEVLFIDFDRICEEVTREYFKILAEGEFDRLQFVPVGQLVAHKEVNQKAGNALTEMFGPNFNTPRMFQFNLVDESSVVNFADLVEKLQSSRATMLNCLPKYTLDIKSFDETQNSWMTRHSVVTFHRIGIRLNKSDFDFPMSTLEAAFKSSEELRIKLAEMHSPLRPLEEAFEKRVAAAMMLLRTPELAAQLGDEVVASLSKQSSTVLNCLLHLQQTYGEIIYFRNNFTSVALAVQACNNNQADNELWGRVKQVGSILAGKIQMVASRFSEIPYPFEHAISDISLGNYLVTKLPNTDDMLEIIQASAGLLENFHLVYFRAIGALGTLVNRIESALGLPQQKTIASEATATDSGTYVV